MKTIAKEQATAAANALLATATRQSGRSRNFFSDIFIPPLLRFPELAELPTEQQLNLIQAACQFADRQIPVVLAWLLFVAALLLTAFFAPPVHNGFPSLFAIFVLVGIPAILILRAAIHRHIRTLLATASSSG
jgi:hypothetical protein